MSEETRTRRERVFIRELAGAPQVADEELHRLELELAALYGSRRQTWGRAALLLGMGLLGGLGSWHREG